MSAALGRLASACILPGVEELATPDWLRRELAGGLGGVVLFSRNVRDRGQLAALTAGIRAEREIALIGLDEEGGDVTRLEVETGSSTPGNLALGAIDDVDLTRRVAATIGAGLASVGVNLDLAPVADVNSNPRNPVIGVRSFGDEPDRVARHVAAFVEGLQNAGVVACAKHFPGHGETETDSHLELPVIAATLDVLRSRELVPFRAAIGAGVRAIMTAHIVVPAVDPDPATVSWAHLHDLLRGELGYEGLVITDALEMRAISTTVGVERGAVAALAAGADAVCLGHDLFAESVASVRAALVDAVRSGELAEERLAESAGRVEAAGTWAAGGAGRGSVVDPGVGLLAARRALRTEGATGLRHPAFVVECVPETTMAADPARHGLAQILHERDPRTRSVRLEAEDDVEVGAGPLTPVLVLRDAGRHDWERRVAERLVGRRPDTIVVDIGYPDWRPGGAAGYLTAFGAGRVNLVAAAELLLATPR